MAADWLAWRPEWPVAALPIVAWAILATHHVGPLGATPAADHLHHDMVMAAPVAPALSLWSWSVMCVAMMAPLALPASRHVGLNSPRHHRFAGVAVFTTAFLLPWVAFGAVLLWISGFALVTDAGLAVGLLVVATGWQLSPWKRRAVLSCSRSVPLAPFGVRAVATRVEFGVRQSLRCMVACWPLMALMVVLPHGEAGLMAMALVTLAMAAESRSRRRRLLIPLLAGPLAVAAVVTGVVVV